MRKVIIASNRLPLTVQEADGVFSCAPSTGGLATGLADLMDSENVVWVGWHGCSQKMDPPLAETLQGELRKEGFEAVELDEDEVLNYYNRIANGVIWPTFHYRIDKLPLTFEGWETYETVNRKFADRIIALHEDGDFVWIHDFHLFLVAAYVREAIPNANIGFFLHIPFPSAEVFRILPWRASLLKGLLGADRIGFHIEAYARNFQESLRQILGVPIQSGTIPYEGRNIRFGAFPLGIDTRRLGKLSSNFDHDLSDALRLMRTEKGINKIIFSVDRLDYTKGLPRKLLTIERLLDDHPELVGKIVFLQIAAPSRDDVRAYKENRDDVELLVGRINGKYSVPGYQPIQYISRAYTQDELVQIFQFIDVMLVTPLMDGMNLVAKEFVAAREDLDGVLVLSEFAGAAEELGEAILVNPYDIEGSAQGLFTAIQMDKQERTERMKHLRKKVSDFDASIWARRFMDFFHSASSDSAEEPSDYASYLAEIIAETAERIVLFLDYDGTLFPIVHVPQMAKPDKPLLNLLNTLGEHERFEIHILSGRSAGEMEAWFPLERIHLHAEHGAMSRPAGADTWITSLDFKKTPSWKPFAKSILAEYSRALDGSYVEEKNFSLVWHYRLAEPAKGEERAEALKTHAQTFLAPLGLEILAGKKAVEIRQIEINKGLMVKRVLDGRADRVFPIAIGDDVTDEDMFRALSGKGMTITVGEQETCARYRLKDPSEVRLFLESLIKSLSKSGQNCG